MWANPQRGHVHFAFGMSYRDLRAMSDLTDTINRSDRAAVG